MFTFLIQATLNTLEFTGGIVLLLQIIIAITKDTLDISPKQYFTFVMWTFLAVMAIKGLILAYHQHN